MRAFTPVISCNASYTAVSRTALCPVAIYDAIFRHFYRGTPELHEYCQSEMMMLKFQIEWATLVVGLFGHVGMWWCVINPIISGYTNKINIPYSQGHTYPCYRPMYCAFYCPMQSSHNSAINSPTVLECQLQ